MFFPAITNSMDIFVYYYFRRFNILNLRSLNKFKILFCYIQTSLSHKGVAFAISLENSVVSSHNFLLSIL